MQNSVSDYLISSAATRPGKTAVRDADGEVSFAELLSCACELACILEGKGIKNRPVAVFLPKGCDMVAAFAGISLSGNFYVPLDTKQPAARLSAIFEVLNPAVVVTDIKLKPVISVLPKCDVVFTTDFTGRDYAQTSFGNLLARARDLSAQASVIDTDPVYAIFTSGSTGTPKGVVVPHRGVIDYIDWAVSTFCIDSTTVIGNQAPFYFDNSTLDIYLMMATGATLDIIPESKFVFPATLVDYIDKRGITFVFWVPFVLVSIANFGLLDKMKPASLRDVFFAGEVMPNKQLNYWRSKLPACRYVNLYGPTEITVDCTYYEVDREFKDDEPLPIGKPCKNSEILILKDRKALCTQGETGEICVRGSSLALGYYNNPAKTAEAFIPNPLQQSYPETVYCTGDLGYWNDHGEVMFVGRADSQIKHKGYRIELGEIETAILGTDLLKEGCVIYNHSKQQITLVYSNNEEITMPSLRKELSDRVPAYMMPSVLIREPQMKRNANGKIDRMYYKALLNG